MCVSKKLNITPPEKKREMHTDNSNKEESCDDMWRTNVLWVSLGFKGAAGGVRTRLASCEVTQDTRTKRRSWGVCVCGVVRGWILTTLKTNVDMSSVFHSVRSTAWQKIFWRVVLNCWIKFCVSGLLSCCTLNRSDSVTQSIYST